MMTTARLVPGLPMAVTLLLIILCFPCLLSDGNAAQHSRAAVQFTFVTAVYILNSIGFCTESQLHAKAGSTGLRCAHRNSLIT